MPGHHRRHHPRPHHPASRTITAAAAGAALLALSACTTSSATTAAPAAATAGAAASSAALTLTGAGSTFDAPFFDLAFARYHQQHPGVAIRYSAVGSSAGIAAFTVKQTDFGASDVPMTATEQAAAHGGASVQVPVDLGAEAIAYNLTGLPGLHLTGPVIARIFLGQITNWRDPAIMALNPHVSLPSQQITVVHRSEPGITPADFSIVNEPGADSYPISGYSWALIYTHQASQATGQALVNLLDWLTHSGQAYAAATGYVPLPPQIQQLARSTLQQVTGPDGTRLLG